MALSTAPMAKATPPPPSPDPWDDGASDPAAEPRKPDAEPKDPDVEPKKTTKDPWDD